MLKLVYTTNVVVTPERGILAPLAKWINSLACCIQRITDLKAARRRLRVSRFHVCFEKSNVITNNLWQLVVRWVRSQNGTKVSPKFCNRNHSSLLMRKEVLPRVYHLLLGRNGNCRGPVARQGRASEQGVPTPLRGHPAQARQRHPRRLPGSRVTVSEGLSAPPRSLDEGGGRADLPQGNARHVDGAREVLRQPRGISCRAGARPHSGAEFSDDALPCRPGPLERGDAPGLRPRREEGLPRRERARGRDRENGVRDVPSDRLDLEDRHDPKRPGLPHEGLLVPSRQDPSAEEVLVHEHAVAPVQPRVHREEGGQQEEATARPVEAPREPAVPGGRRELAADRLEGDVRQGPAPPRREPALRPQPRRQ